MEQILYIITRGFAIGGLISAPMGPIGMLVIQRTLSKGQKSGFYTGIGASLSDLIYCLLTGFCLSFVTGIIDRHQLIIQIAGSVVVAVFGIYLFRKNPTRQLRTAAPAGADPWSDFISGFLLTFSNPLILFFIVGLFARFNLILPEYYIHHYIVAYFSILVGALFWWGFVTYLVNKLRRRFNVRALWLVNRIVGTVLIVMGIVGMVMCLI